MLTALVGVAAVLAWRDLPSAVDDAFVAARYAEHLAEGHGWTWSRHAPPVEGFTSAAWVAWIAVGLGLGAPVHDWVVGSGLAGGLTALPGAWLLARALADRPGPGALVAPALLACSPLFAVASTNGLETSWFVAAALWSSWAALRAEGRWEPVLGAGLGSLAWLRPEGVALGLVWLGWRWWDGRGWRAAGAAFAAVVGAWVAWRLATFGTWLPNPAGAKLGALSWSDLLASNRLYLERDRWTWPVVALLGLLSAASPDRRRLALAAAIAAVTVPALLVPMWMPGGRLLLAGFALTAAAVGGRLADRPRVAAALAALAAASGMALDRGARAQDVAHTVAPSNDAATAARWLADHAPPDASLAVRDAGCFAYWAGTGFTAHELHERALTRPHPGLADAVPDAPTDPTVLVLTQAREAATDVRYPLDRRAFEAVTVPYVYLGRVHQHHHRYYDVYARVDAGFPPLPEELVVNRLGPPPPSR